MPTDMPQDREPPADPPNDSAEVEVLRDLLEHVKEVSRGIVEKVNKVLPGDADEPRPPAD